MITVEKKLVCNKELTHIQRSTKNAATLWTEYINQQWTPGFLLTVGSSILYPKEWLFYAVCVITWMLVQPCEIIVWMLISIYKWFSVCITFPDLLSYVVVYYGLIKYYMLQSWIIWIFLHSLVIFIIDDGLNWSSYPSWIIFA